MPPAVIDPHDPDVLRGLRGLAEQAARAGGVVARAAFGRVQSVRRKADGSEVTDADEAAQAAVIACLQAGRAGDAIIAEETLAGGTGAAPPCNDVLCWVVDPLDGTRNYVRGVPLYAVSVAAMFAGVPIVGAIYEPERDELYSAGGVSGMVLNGQPLPAAGREGIGKPLAGIPSSIRGPARQVLDYWHGKVVLRNLGTTALHLALVAARRFQAVLISDGRLWDIAAGWLLVTATGGVVTTLQGADVFPLDVERYAGERLPCVATCDRQSDGWLPPGAARGS